MVICFSSQVWLDWRTLAIPATWTQRSRRSLTGKYPKNANVFQFFSSSLFHSLFLVSLPVLHWLSFSWTVVVWWRQTRSQRYARAIRNSSQTCGTKTGTFLLCCFLFHCHFSGIFLKKQVFIITFIVFVLCGCRNSYVVPTNLFQGIKAVNPMFRGYSQQVCFVNSDLFKN